MCGDRRKEKGEWTKKRGERCKVQKPNFSEDYPEAVDRIGSELHEIQEQSRRAQEVGRLKRLLVDANDDGGCESTGLTST